VSTVPRGEAIDNAYRQRSGYRSARGYQVVAAAVERGLLFPNRARENARRIGCPGIGNVVDAELRPTAPAGAELFINGKRIGTAVEISYSAG
jgi:hypothetical protein